MAGMKDKNQRAQWRRDTGQSTLLAVCLQLCEYPVASTERARFMFEILTHWPLHRVWVTIEEYPELFRWQVSIQSARLTELGLHWAKTSRYLVRAELGSSDHAPRSEC